MNISGLRNIIKKTINEEDGANVSSFGDPSEWQRKEREDREIGRPGAIEDEIGFVDFPKKYCVKKIKEMMDLAGGLERELDEWPNDTKGYRNALRQQMTELQSEMWAIISVTLEESDEDDPLLDGGDVENNETITSNDYPSTYPG